MNADDNISLMSNQRILNFFIVYKIMIIIYEILTSNKLNRKNIFWFVFFGLMVFNATFNNISFYYIMLYFTVFLLARSNTRDIPFSNILISKKLFMCNKKNILHSRAR